MPEFDLRPRIVFRTSAGAVVVLVDPTDVAAGNIVFPIIGAVPYRIDFDPTQLFPQPRVVLSFPTGEVFLPVDLTTLGGGGASVIDLPGLGPTPYEVVLGPPLIPPEELASPWSVMSFGLSTMWPVLLLGAGAVILMMRRR